MCDITELDVLTRDKLRKQNSTYYDEELDCMIQLNPEKLTVFSEGDSWFAYPRENLVIGRRANIIDHLEEMADLNLLRLSSSGDEAVEMLKGQSKFHLKNLLEKYSNSLRFLLFSGGGNDIVGKWDMESLLNRRTAGMKWKDCINHEAFERKLAEIKSAYRDLATLRDTFAPQCVIITHTYDYPIPSDKGGEFLWGSIRTKPWIKPYMDQKGITVSQDQRKIARHMMENLANTLISLKKEQRDFYVIDLRGKFQESDWVNEIHLTPDGFRRVAEIFLKKMQKIARKRSWPSPV
ncbi:hypothetical protein ACQZV8_06325 [Magnetococcales bacterium HHB-1]